ncbi:hypothetical protein [Lactococcus garvieae]|uniref:Uncharacterized protein n=1 Tax=Lactococcus garvieae DCC43 TaxID=1231377 RepID=K2NT55_9LACT|nr:hypothetical protein [Lactococcus garvieae]EKF50778.1 hypothetical protein C426_1829 [Lactococcus garvieae DCC43]
MENNNEHLVLRKRDLRRYNGAVVKLFDGRRGKITYPYIILSEDNKKHPVMIENNENFKEIHKVIIDKQVFAERKTPSCNLRVL